jgi:hypothetical protein
VATLPIGTDRVVLGRGCSWLGHAPPPFSQERESLTQRLADSCWNIAPRDHIRRRSLEGVGICRAPGGTSSRPGGQPGTRQRRRCRPAARGARERSKSAELLYLCLGLALQKRLCRHRARSHRDDAAREHDDAVILRVAHADAGVPQPDGCKAVGFRASSLGPLTLTRA